MYEIKVLSHEEFDNLPIEETRGSDISNSLGFGNKFTKRAYVRDTGIHDLNKYLINHEFEELEADESTHEDENGIRHKKFFKELILPLFTGGLGGLFGGGGEAERAEPETPSPFSGSFMGAPFSGSYSPTTGSGSPLDSFSGSYSPANVPNAISGSYSPTIGLGGGLTADNVNIPEEQRRRMAGFDAGRLVF